MSLDPTAFPDISVVIPVFNEALIVEPAVRALATQLDALGWSYEIILAENGSNDGTPAILATLALTLPRVRVVSTSEPNYGRALRQGILGARARIVLSDEIDLCDIDFHRRAVAELDAGRADLVVGSKVGGGARDQRPLFRRLGTRAYTTLLRVLLGFRGTDTHGPKGFHRETLLPIVETCVVERDVFASELVIRAWRADLRVIELPILIAERRPPSIHLWRRVPNVLRTVWTLRRALSSRPPSLTAAREAPPP